MHRLDTSGPGDLIRAIVRLRRVVERERPDVVHTHLFAANVAGRCAARRDSRVVTSLHNPDYTFEDNGTLRFRVRKALDRWTGNRCNRLFIAVSEAVKADYELHLGFRPIRVLPNYLDIAALRRRCDAVDRSRERLRMGVRDDEVVVLHVGRFHRQKAQDLLLRAFAEARTEEPLLRLCLAGDGAELPEARALAGHLDLGDAAFFTGAVADPVPLYVAADLFAFPSRWEASEARHRSARGHGSRTARGRVTHGWNRRDRGRQERRARVSRSGHRVGVRVALARPGSRSASASRLGGGASGRGLRRRPLRAQTRRVV